MYRYPLALLFLIGLPLTAAAQAPPPAPLTGYYLQIFQNGSLLQGQGEKPIALNEFVCGQQPAAGTPPATIMNPTRIEIDDPASTANPRLKCVTSQVSFFRALPPGISYRAILFAESNLAQPPNNRSNPLVVLPDFSTSPVSGPPAAPTGGRLLQ